MEQTTECVSPVEDTIKEESSKLITFIGKIYYHLTAYFPRKLPQTEEELVALRDTLIRFYGLEDKVEVWYTIAGQISAARPTQIRKPYAHLVNAAKRLKTNTLAQRLKEVIIEAHEQRINKITENIVASPQATPEHEEHPADPVSTR